MRRYLGLDEMSKKYLFAPLFFLLSFANAAYAQDCIEITEDSKVELSGKLSFHILPAQPEYEDINKGDWYESGYFLSLTKPICFVGVDFAGTEFNTIQLLNGYDYNKTLFKGTEVKVKLGGIFAGFNGHHHAPALGNIVTMKQNGKIIAPTKIVYETRKTYDEDKDITEEYGTPMPIIRAFYLALKLGRGDLAQEFITPEKRDKGAFSIIGMNKFYGNLKKPILLQNLEKTTETQYRVTYNYSYGKNTCDGEADVNIIEKDGRWFIGGIKALSGC